MSYEEEIQTLVDAGQLTDAISFAKAHAVNALQRAAMIEYHIGHLDEAIKLATLCTDLNPHEAKLYGNLSFFLGNQMKGEEALKAIDEAISLENLPEYHYNRALLLSSLMRVDESIESYETLLRMRPDYDIARFNLGCLLMLRGEYRKGYAYLECRFKQDSQLGKFRQRYNRPDWDGTDLAGKRLLVFSEQGFGDAIQYVRYVPQLKKAAFLIAELQKSLVPLLRDFFDVTVAGSNDYQENEPINLPDYDCVISLSSLPHLLDPDLSRIPPTPYLFAKPHDFPHDKLNVGLTWAGNPKYANDINRSFQAKRFLSLATLPQIRLYNLQRGQMKRSWFGEIDLSDGIKQLNLNELEIDNFADTARYIKGLDLVISADTAVAHLAGALNVPVWVLLPFCHDYRWSLNKTTTPWYASMRIFRQKKAGDWDGVIAEIVEEIKIMDN